MKRYDGRTKPIPKQRPTTGKGKKAKKLVSTSFTMKTEFEQFCCRIPRYLQPRRLTQLQQSTCAS